MWTRLLYKFHRILGSGLSILFLLWFMSGFVMIYHNFPKITEKQKYSGLSVLHSNDIDSLLDIIPQGLCINYLALKCNAEGRPQIEYSEGNNHYRITENGNIRNRAEYTEIKNYASNVNNSPITKVDTINALDRWLPYDKYKADFPVYKFYFEDEKQSQLYVSSLTGEGIQYSDSENRFWAWVGAIPHWLYIANLRHYTDIWKNIVIILSGIGSLMCISGIILGSRSYYTQYKRRKNLKSPYRKFSYKWHHILGFIFGIFIFTFAFSGMMSLQKIPQWIIKTHNPSLQAEIMDNPLTLYPGKYPLNYKSILSVYKNKIQKLEWCSFGNKPFYKAVINDSLYFFDATSDTVKQLYLTENNIIDRINLIQTETMQIELMNDYDNYYIHKKQKLPLPVYKVTMNDIDKSTYYINPETTDIRYFNTNTKVRKWTYQALHSFSIKWLLDKPVLWNIIMWTTMIGCSLVSITGIWLSMRYISRKRKGGKV